MTAYQQWMREGACRGADMSLFFGPDFEKQAERDVREAEAKAVCAICPVRWRCRSYSLAKPENAGVWGGMGEEERQQERRRYLRRIRERAA
jgi:WhiB family transcriptional regulator, redox-sensing transcriptional regulator